VNNPKQWKFRQSTSAANDVGSASAAAPSLDDSAWADVNLRWKEFPGPNVANHFRKDFAVADLGVELFQVEGIQVSLQYDDTAVMYLNGVEVYRSIRGNLDPDYSPYALGDDIPYDVAVPWGGQEEFYVDVPNVNQTNTCEYNGSGCIHSPYGGPDTPEIPVSLLNENGVNTWSVTTWNESGGGTGDSSFNHTFELLIDESAVPVNPIFINEAMASNDTAYGVQLDADPQLEYPDWFELHNVTNNPVNLLGWTVSDTSASWVFPSVIVPANGFLIVAASDNDRTDTTPLQTNFKLSSLGDALRLTNPEGFVADEYGVLPQQFTDNSYGRPNNSGAPTYLASSTPGETNSVAGNGYVPILRPFANRLYNQGESVAHQVNAFDPDGDSLTYTFTQAPPGLTMSASGLITGTLNQPGTFSSTITVEDADTDSASQVVQWLVFPAVTSTPPIVLNEYNAVADTRELLGGSPVGNGGDWFEFVVVEDNLDLRGTSIEIYDQKGTDDQLRLASTVTFGNDIRLAQARAGTIVTIGEELADDLSFDVVSDWHIHFQVTNEGTGSFFGAPSADAVFNSTRSGQMVLLKNAAGTIVAPLSGETEAWKEAGAGVGGAEVMNLCVSPTADFSLDPIADYQDNGETSTFGQPNTCSYPDPADRGTTITFTQDLSSLRNAVTPSPTATPTAVPTATATPSPTATATPTATPTATATPVPTVTPMPSPTATPESNDADIALTDPFICGVGFFGTITGGTAPYELAYSLSPQLGGAVVELGSFVVSSAGAFASPTGYISPLNGINADFDVSIALTDAMLQQLDKPNLFVADVRSSCATGSASSSPALTYPGPFNGAPRANAIGSSGAQAPSPAPQNPAPQSPVPQNANVADGMLNPPTSSQPPLATTGSDTPLLATVSLILLSMGGALMVASRRKERGDC
jgi:hypothetical protein